MEAYFVMMIIPAILGMLGYAVWFFLFVWVVKKRLRDLDHSLPNIEHLIRSYQSLPVNQQAQQKMQIMNMLMQANSQLGQMQDIHRQKYELRVSELHGMAANAGIDWTPPSY